MERRGATEHLDCPMCDCEISLTGDERVGDEVYCPYCETPLKLKQTTDDEPYLQEDF